jgi:hypothetical protein
MPHKKILAGGRRRIQSSFEVNFRGDTSLTFLVVLINLGMHFMMREEQK